MYKFQLKFSVNAPTMLNSLLKHENCIQRIFHFIDTLKHRYHACKPLLGGVNTTACAKAVNTDCSARPIRNFPAKDLKEVQVYRVIRKDRVVLNYVHNYLSIKCLSPYRASHLS